MVDYPFPVRWSGRQAVVTLPEHIDASNVGQVREELLAIINRGAAVLIADMSGTVSCDHGGAGALIRAYHRAAVNGTRLRLVVRAQLVRRVLEVNGLDRLISIYPSLETAAGGACGAAGTVIPLAPRRAGASAAGHAPPGTAAQRQGGQRATASPAVLTPAVLWKLIEALADGVALTDDDGVLALVSGRLEAMFGYPHGELIGQPVECLLPADLRAAHRKYRDGYARDLRARPMGAGTRLVGLRKDGTTFPVEISLSPVRTATGHFTLALVRDIAGPAQGTDPADLATAAAAGEPTGLDAGLLSQIAGRLLDVGRCMKAAIAQPHEISRSQITDALRHLDDTIDEIRARAPAGSAPPYPVPPAGAG